MTRKNNWLVGISLAMATTLGALGLLVALGHSTGTAMASGSGDSGPGAADCVCTE